MNILWMFSFLNKEAIDLNIIKQIKPQTVITNSAINKQISEYCSTHKIQLLSSRNNTIQWNPQIGFQQYNNQE